MNGQTGAGWKRLIGNGELRERLIKRAKIISSVRAYFEDEGFLEIDVPILVPLPGMEPHLSPLEVAIHDRGGHSYPFFLHTSPEYALKKLLAAGFEKIFALTHAFRDGEVSETHNLEFTLLEWYRAGADYARLMRDCEELFARVAESLGHKDLRISYQGKEIDLRPPWPRLTMREAVQRFAGVDISGETTIVELVAIAHAKGYREARPDWPWEDVFYLIFLNEVEPRLPQDRPVFLTEYPVQMGALARRKPDDPSSVERFELYVGGLELANAFSELTDPIEQRQRLLHEQDERRQLGRTVYPVDESFLEALEVGLPDSAGIALGVDRLVMLFT
ncbi:MAG: EF-P lysine aminoacylase GenX, partial [Calditrichaeota bacterium]|nr:EF-P lysine aminoacylase GenX [Calditrichota bacterium]